MPWWTALWWIPSSAPESWTPSNWPTVKPVKCCFKPRREGFGNTVDFDLNLVIPDANKTLSEGAIEPWTKPKYRTLQADLRKFAKQYGIPMDVAWADLEPDQRQLVLEGKDKFPGVQGF